MAVMARESWTDERLDDLKEQMNERFDRADREMNERFDRADREMNERFDRVEGQVKEVRAALKDLHDDNKATNRVMMQGFIAMAGAIVTACMLVMGAAVL